MGVDPEGQLARILPGVARFRPDVVLMTGDLAHDGALASYHALHRALASLASPIIAIPGNHDDPTSLRRVFGPWPLVASFGSWRVILFATHIRGRDGGALRIAELKASAETLGHAPAPPTLLALHHPPVAVGSPWLDAMGLQGAQRLGLWLAEHACVRLVLCGHVHQAVRRRITGVPVLSSPATSIQFMPNTRRCQVKDRRPAWRALWLAQDGTFRTRVHRLDRNHARS